MTQEDKKLLLRELSARLPYGVKVTWDGKYPLTVTPHIYCAIASEDKINNLPKLLLRPMSNMTEVEKHIYNTMTRGYTVHQQANLFDWLNKKMFDYRGLIEKDLAIKVTKDNNPYKE